MKEIEELNFLETKEKLVEKRIKNSQKSSEIYKLSSELKKKIEEIKKKTQQQIIENREKLRQKIMARKRDEERRRILFEKQLNEKRRNITEKILTVNRLGDLNNCSPERPENEIIDYCNINFKEINEQTECLKHDRFCYNCCENEFGEMHMKERETCFSKCNEFYIEGVSFGVENKNNASNNNLLNLSRYKQKDEGLNINELKNNEYDLEADIDKLIEETRKKDLLLSIKNSLDI